MNIDFIFYESQKKKTFFSLSAGMRSYAIFLIIVKGSCHLKFRESGEIFRLKPYEIAYFPPNTEFFREVIEPIEFHQFSFRIQDGESVYGIIPNGRLDIPEQQVMAIINASDKISRFPSDMNLLSAHIVKRIIADYYMFSSASSDKEARLSNEILQATDYIQAHVNEEISVSALADSLHLSHNGLIYKFKKELGTTPSEYITGCRIKLAKKLLLEEDLTISRVAEKCGYANAYYFSNAFKKNEGVCPSDFRKKCNG